jgi:hypothetical protein
MVQGACIYLSLHKNFALSFIFFFKSELLVHCKCHRSYVFWSRTVSRELASLWKSSFSVLPPLLAMCQFVKIVCNTNTVFYKVMCKVFGYQNVLNTLDLEKSLV